MTVCLCALLLHCSVLKKRTGTGPVFAEHHIDASMAKVRLMDLQETVQVGAALSTAALRCCS